MTDRTLIFPKGTSRRSLLIASAVGVAATHGLRTPSMAQAPPSRFEVYKTPTCGCCGAWIAHLRSAGFDGHATDVEDLDPIKNRLGVAAELRSCHTAMIDGYVIEGHVPAREIVRLLRERPRASGLAVPGMPIGSPGMEMGDQREPYQVILFSASSRTVYARY
jgi:hypothetical protein